ncbi:E3 ubiquitin-protein ligase RNF26-like [Oncorhynchus keta]|uniref:E3 ubiquitin-protein ligase RNF26-like n=1 Tax=Oncorhynchus keta TaxID=8018 RepID=UPI00227BEB38|nr:E3 ubiquitin-protein ligase RNF26-like [Oncorhynchus keta]
MGLVNLVFCTIGKCFDFIFFLLDLNFLIVHSVIRFLAACINFVNKLPMILTNSMVKCWNFTVFCMVAMMDSVSLLAQGTVNMLGRWLQLLGGILESFKMVGYLSSHVLLHVRDLFHRGLLCGLCLLQQVWEGCGIAVSLVLYLVNTVVNLLLIGTQNVYSVVVSMWEAVSYPLQKAMELTLTLFTFLYSSLLALDFLGLLGHIFVLQRGCSIGSARWGGRVAEASAAGQPPIPNDNTSLQEHQSERVTPGNLNPVTESRGALPDALLRGGGTSSKGPPKDSLLTLLQEQEERKKCIICQDSTKTVVLLPCRHLCLCRDCTNILLRQPIYQQNCPLCRHMILNTMDVYL